MAKIQAPSPRPQSPEAPPKPTPKPKPMPTSHHEPRISWLLVLPLLALILVAPPALGSYSAMRTGTALQKQPWGFADLPAGDTVRLNLVDYAGRAAYDHGRSLDHRHIKIAGLLALDRDGTPYLVRMALSCCAADAQPVKIGLTGRIPPVLRPDTWLEATGTYTAKRTKDPVNDGLAHGVKPVKAPRDPYDESSPLPNGFLPEGIAIGSRPYAYMGSRANGAIHRTDLRTGEGEILPPRAHRPGVRRT
jgi:uncharacterized repeat protein (TIGR03943 family)